MVHLNDTDVWFSIMHLEGSALFQKLSAFTKDRKSNSLCEMYNTPKCSLIVLNIILNRFYDISAKFTHAKNLHLNNNKHWCISLETTIIFFLNLLT